MKTFLLVASLLAAAVLVLALFNALKNRRTTSLSYSQGKPLTEPEQTLYWRLIEALPECVILSQVTFSRFIKPSVSRGSRDYRSLQNRIAQKSADFVICLRDFTLVAVVELDDGSHDTVTDAERDRLLAAAGLQVVRFTVRDLPSVAKVREQIAGREGVA